MKVIRLVLTQNKAHYKKEETVTNKMTYPLPPFSTVIGAIHNACNYKNYHPMDLSIQGSFETVGQEVYTDHCFLNSVMDDRGILVKSMNGDLQSKGFVKVAKALKGTGNSFKKGITIQVYDQELMNEYLKLKDINDEITEFKNSRLKKVQDLIKLRKKSLKSKKQKFDKKSEEFSKLSLRESEIQKMEKLILERLENYVFENCTKELSKYQSLTTAPKYYEVLYGVKLIVHISSDEETLKDIKENIYNLRAIGRSEDFVDVEECEYVDLADEVEDEIRSEYSAYLNYDLVKKRSILLNHRRDGIPASGTKYWINKVYDKSKGYRDFKALGQKVKVVYGSNFLIDDESEGVYFDGKFIVNFN